MTWKSLVGDNSDVIPCGKVILYKRMTLLCIFLAISFLVVIFFSLGFIRLFKEFLYGKAYSVLFLVDFGDLRLNNLSDCKILRNVGNSVKAYLADMDKTVHAGDNLSKSTKGGRTRR